MSTVSAKTCRFVLFACLSACVCHAASANSPVVIYYSFDTPPDPATLAAMKAETARIFDPASISINWRPLSPHGGESDGELVIARFSGSCSGAWSTANHAANAGGFPLADSKTANGHVLPFADIDCAALRAYLATGRFEDPAASLGRAMARVLSHEIYHILTASTAHARTGIARAEHSRDDLTASTFTFGKSEIDWLKEWSARTRTMVSGGYGSGAGDDSGAQSDAGSR